MEILKLLLLLSDTQSSIPRKKFYIFCEIQVSVIVIKFHDCYESIALFFRGCCSSGTLDPATVYAAAVLSLCPVEQCQNS